MKQGRRGFFGMIAAAFAGAGAVAATETGVSLKGLAAKVAPLNAGIGYSWTPIQYGVLTDPPRRNWVAGNSISINLPGLDPRMPVTVFVNGVQVPAITVNTVSTAGTQPLAPGHTKEYVRVDAEGKLVPFYDERAIAEAVARAIQRGNAGGLVGALRNRI